MSLPASPGKVEALDLALALALGLLAAWACWSLTPARFAFDGPQLASVYALRPEALHWHVLYLPLAHWIGALLPGSGPYDGLVELGLLSGGIGVACSYLLPRLLGADRPASILAAATVGSARHVVFFASVVEVHALHFAVVGLAACATLVVPWRRPRLALLMCAALFAVTWTSHASAPLMWPGWVLLVELSRRRAGLEPYGVRELAQRVAPALGGAMLLVAAPFRIATHLPGRAPIDVRLVASYSPEGDSLRFLWEGLLLPIGPLFPLVVWGLLRHRQELRGACLLALLLPATAFFLWWGVPEGGGYFVGQGALHAAAVGLALSAPRHRLALAVGLAVVAIQAPTSRLVMAGFDDSRDPASRAALAFELATEQRSEPSPPISLATFTFLAPSLEIEHPQIEELDLIRTLVRGWRAGRPPGEVVAELRPTLESALDERVVLLDLSDPGDTWDHSDPELRAYVREFTAELLARTPHQRRERDGWSLVRLERAKATQASDAPTDSRR